MVAKWGHSHATLAFGAIHDVILFYTRTTAHKLNPAYVPHRENHLKAHFRHDDGDGKGPYGLAPLTGNNAPQTSEYRA